MTLETQKMQSMILITKNCAGIGKLSLNLVPTLYQLSHSMKDV